jgi:hypothetical protein
MKIFIIEDYYSGTHDYYVVQSDTEENAVQKYIDVQYRGNKPQYGHISARQVNLNEIESICSHDDF